MVSGIALGILFIKSILAAVAFLLVMQGIKTMDISRALPLLVLTPALVALFAFIFLGDSLKIIEVVGMAFLLLGSYVLQINGKTGLLSPFKNFIETKGNYYILGALALYTTTAVLDKLLLGGYKVPLSAFMGYQHLFFAIIFFILGFIFLRDGEIKSSFKFSWKIIGVLALATIVYRYSQYYAVSVAPVALVLALKRTAVFLAVLFGGVLFKDKNLLERVVATGLMILGAVLIIMN